MRGALLAAAAVVAGCSPVTRIGDKIIGLTNPVLIGGLVLGTRPPDDPDLRAALELAGVTGFTEVQLVVADALELQDIDQALLTEAEVTVRTPDPFAMAPGGDGWFRLEAAQAPSYAVGGTWTIEAELPDRVLPGTVTVSLPNVAEIDPDIEREAGEELVFDLTGQGFDYAFAGVWDLQGEERFSSAPTTNDEIVDLVLPTSDPVEVVSVPGDVLAEEGVYIVGFAGMQRAPAENVEGLNEALTAVLAGRLEIFPVVVGSRVGAVAMFLDAEAPEPGVGALLAGADIPVDGLVEVFALDLLASGAGLEGADATLDGEPLEDLGEGRYRIEGVELVPGQAPALRIASPLTSPGTLTPTLPDAPPVEVPDTGILGQGLTVAFPGGGYRIGLGAVVGPTGVTWSNVPQTPETWRYVLQQEDADVASLRIPSTAFPGPGVYAVAVAPVGEPPAAIVDLNAGLTRALAGTWTFHQVLITP